MTAVAFDPDEVAHMVTEIRRRQGLPDRVEDPSVIASVVARVNAVRGRSAVAVPSPEVGVQGEGALVAVGGSGTSVSQKQNGRRGVAAPMRRPS